MWKGCCPDTTPLEGSPSIHFIRASKNQIRAHLFFSYWVTPVVWGQENKEGPRPATPEPPKRRELPAIGPRPGRGASPFTGVCNNGEAPQQFNSPAPEIRLGTPPPSYHGVLMLPFTRHDGINGTRRHMPSMIKDKPRGRTPCTCLRTRMAKAKVTTGCYPKYPNGGISQGFLLFKLL